ncbi:hypothetical protein M9H77_32714 [Catharanthus roseus]|uniref:Uncharacterized protein n=1 Tax=Catharanthus roseus TaxID=4058 RepID=A0ACC0A3P8_CATRO|nr:hypothetical protein M9H77_32714 [Catharanthus roseus]
MPPRKRTVVEASTRVTRSSARGSTLKVNVAESPKKKKAKKSPGKKKSEPENPKIQAETAAEEKKIEDGSNRKTVIIEHCKQCNQFKIRALQVKNGLEKGLEGEVNVIINPEKPRRGCFEIREEGENGEKFISLLDMKRPFGPMKALDMEQVISDIIEKIK